jgi:polysaccharide export outer membrane protein
MKRAVKAAGRNWVTAGMAMMVAILASGCLETASGGKTGASNAATAGRQDKLADQLRIGDDVKVEFLGLPTPVQPVEEHIKDDGTISLPLVGTIEAAGKTARELEKIIEERYVPKYYKRLKVAVVPRGRFFSVGGEVRNPNRQPYLGSMTVLQAIQSAGDFTDFADKKRVKLIRSDGKVEIINVLKARKNPSLNLPVYPGDTIHVERSIM